MEGVPGGEERTYLNDNSEKSTEKNELSFNKAEADEKHDNSIPATNIPLPSTTAHPEQAKAEAPLKNPPPSILDSPCVKTAVEEESDDEITVNDIPDQLLFDYPQAKEEEDDGWCLVESEDAVAKDEGGKGRMFGFW